MIYSYTQLAHYLACPRRYRYRYVDGWREKDTRASMLFGRAFELALGAYFHRQDASEVPVQGVVRVPEHRARLHAGGQLGPDAGARHQAAGALCAVRPGRRSVSQTQPADQDF